MRRLRLDTLISMYHWDFAKITNVVINARHKFILIWARNNNNSCLVGDLATKSTLELFKVHWRMPHVLLSEINKLSMLRALESGRYLSMVFRSWNLHEFPPLQSTTKQDHQDGYSARKIMLHHFRYANRSKKCYVRGYKSIQRLQINHCETLSEFGMLSVIRWLNLDFNKNKCAILYDLYDLLFCKDWYGYEYLELSLIFTTFFYVMSRLWSSIALDRTNRSRVVP